MTPAINQLIATKIKHSVLAYTHDPTSASFGLEAAEKLNLPSKLVFKTLMVTLDGRDLVVAIVPVDTTLNMKKLAKIAKSKKAEMASQQSAEKSSGYILGGISPLGQKRKLKTFIDESALEFEKIYVSGGKRGLEIELSALDLISITKAVVCSLKK